MKPYQKTNKNFVSEIDKRLAEFDHTHAKSATQQAEINKYKAIYQKRNQATVINKPKDLWDFNDQT